MKLTVYLHEISITFIYIYLTKLYYPIENFDLIIFIYIVVKKTIFNFFLFLNHIIQF